MFKNLSVAHILDLAKTYYVFIISCCCGVKTYYVLNILLCDCSKTYEVFIISCVAAQQLNIFHN